MNRSLLVLLCLLITACEGRVGISLSATPSEETHAAVLRITAIDLRRDDGSTVTIDVDPDRDVDLLALDRGAVTALISDSKVGAGNYTSLTLQLAMATDVRDSYIEDSSGAEFPLVLRSGASATAAGGFSIRDDEDTRLTVHVDLRSSLLFGETSAGERQLAPRLRVIEDGDGGSISGNAASALLGGAGCATTAAEQEGTVVYVFSGNVTPDDLDGVTPDPLTTALLRSSDTQSDYVVPFLPAGSYTLALSCEADLDNPLSNDTIRFIASTTATVSAASTSTADFQ